MSQLYSYTIITGMVLLVIAVVSTIFYVQWYMTYKVSDPNTQKQGNNVASVASAIQIIVLGNMYDGLARSLTDGENHRYD
jgi:Calcium-activated chloride channel